jgi:hypothetical protein
MINVTSAGHHQASDLCDLLVNPSKMFCELSSRT